jgi:hypothetical protein
MHPIWIHRSRNPADDILTAEASKITLTNVPGYEKKDARMVATIVAAKSRLGLGLKKINLLRCIIVHKGIGEERVQLKYFRSYEC